MTSKTTENYDIFISYEIYVRTLGKIIKQANNEIFPILTEDILEEQGEEEILNDVKSVSYLLELSMELIKNLVGKTIVNFGDMESRKSQYEEYNNGGTLDTYERELITKAIHEAHFHPLKDLRGSFDDSDK